jgi:hypothetical protein
MDSSGGVDAARHDTVRSPTEDFLDDVLIQLFRVFILLNVQGASGLLDVVMNHGNFL